MTDDTRHPYDGIEEDRKTPPPFYFNLLYYGLIAWGAVFIAYFLLSGWSSTEEFQTRMAVHQASTQAVAPAPAAKP